MHVSCEWIQYVTFIRVYQSNGNALHLHEEGRYISFYQIVSTIKCVETSKMKYLAALVYKRLLLHISGLFLC